MDGKCQKLEKSLVRSHTHLKGTVHTFTLNIYNNLTKLKGTQVKLALKIPTFTKSIKPVKSSVASVPLASWSPLEFQYARVHGNI